MIKVIDLEEWEKHVNGDPYRTPQPSDRRVINRSGSSVSTPAGQAQRPAEEPQPAAPRAEPRASSARAVAPESHSKKGGRGLMAAIIAVLVLAVLAGGFVLFNKLQSSAPAIDASKYQAVSFSDGQLYFGKLSSVNSEYLKLTDVYYLQPQSGEESTGGNLQNSNSSQNNFKLIKFTDVIYGPEDEMIIPKSQVLFYENIQKDGKVTQLIEQQKSGK